MAHGASASLVLECYSYRPMPMPKTKADNRQRPGPERASSFLVLGALPLGDLSPILGPADC
eukprot:scaffold11540_cov116-Isochrysis_galbana.AAC.2